MKEIIAIVLSVVVSLGTVVPASAGEGYIKGPNGRLTYWNDGQPGYYAPPRQQRHYNNRRDYRHDNRRPDNSALGIILFGAGVAIGAAVASSQHQQRYATPLSSEQEHCADTNGVWLEDIYTGRQFCGWR